MSELLDNRAHRIRTLKEVIRHLHEGRAPAEVRERMNALVRECDASEVAAMEQELMAEGIPASEILRMCDLHSQAVRDVLKERGRAPLPPGHPVDTFRRENEALRAQATVLRQALGALSPEGADDERPVDPEALLACRRAFNALMDVDKHYLRKEHLLFSVLERHGITGPSKVMWGKDDEVRALLRALGDALGEAGGTVGEWRTVTAAVAEPALRAVEEMVFKEERILLPMSLQNLTEAEWAEIHGQTPQFGYCLVEPAQGYVPAPIRSDVPAAVRTEAEHAGVAFAPPEGYGGEGSAVPSATGAGREGARPRAAATQGQVVFPTGALTLEQLKALFATLPVDLTFVDAEDRVRFFSEGPNRVFVRPKTVVGRLVQHCHPPSSVDTVERILSDFRAGRQDVAEFWIDYRGRFVQIRYFAVRDASRAYLGTLEVTQDITRERTLTGERRLLQYDA